MRSIIGPVCLFCRPLDALIGALGHSGTSADGGNNQELEAEKEKEEERAGGGGGGEGEESC